MQRVRVESSTIASLGYDPAVEVLEVEFTNGGVYQYEDVPADLYADLLAAASHGSFLNEYVINKFSTYRIASCSGIPARDYVIVEPI